VLNTVQPPVHALHEQVVTGATRHGKFLALHTDGPALVIHLARAGWLRWSDSLAPAPPRPGKGPIALRVHLSGGTGFDLTEAGTQKRLAVYVVADAAGVAASPGIHRLGPDALELTREQLGELLRGRSERLKTVLTDQTLIAGIGNAYSDEILHAAALSPYAIAGRLPDDALNRLHEALQRVLREAIARCVGQDAARLKAEKRAGLAVHARAGLPCPVCGDTVREVSFADRSFQYCPTCQTGGKPLADRRLSRLLR
jgi:formamidopyrimidine-DNA glycosylase